MIQSLKSKLGIAKNKQLDVFSWLFLGAPLAIWFSYHPLLRFGQDATMYFELSVTVIYFLIWALSGLSLVWQKRRQLINNKTVWLVGLLVLIDLISLFWAVNLTRGILTSGLLGVLFLILLGLSVRRQQITSLLPAFMKITIGSAVVMSLLSFGQFVAGIWLDQETTLLCAGCVIEQMGYVRPSVFMIEPQFFGNALLPAALFLSYRVLVKKSRLVDLVQLLIILTALVLTVSRGAIFAFVAGLVILLIFYARNWRRFGLLFVSSLAALIITLGAQGLAAELSPRVDETFLGATTKSIEQLSMGLIDISVSGQDLPPANNALEAVTTPSGKAPAFDGYVEESTNTRLNLAKLAIETWADDLLRVFCGVGVGGSGAAMNNFAPEQIDARQIVQNQYLEILLENGLFGLVLFVALLVGLFIKTRRQYWAWAVIAAFMVQWNFFSGYPNALQVYLILIALAVFADKLAKSNYER